MITNQARGSVHTPRRATHRSCRECGAVLAADNHTDLCSPCARTVISGRVPTLASDFWDRPEIKKAVQARHFGALLRAYRALAYAGAESIRLLSHVIGRSWRASAAR